MNAHMHCLNTYAGCKPRVMGDVAVLIRTTLQDPDLLFWQFLYKLAAILWVNKLTGTTDGVKAAVRAYLACGIVSTP